MFVTDGTLEWVQVPGDSMIMEQSDNLFVIYRGTVMRSKGDARNVSDVYGRRNGRCSHDFIGDLSLVKDLLDQKIHDRGAEFGSDDAIDKVQILKTGPKGDLLLKINTDKLITSAQSDSNVAESIKNMIFNGIQDRLKLYEPMDTNSVRHHDAGQSNRTDSGHLGFQI